MSLTKTSAFPGTASDKWLTQALDENDQAAIIAFPYAGGGPSVFHGWDKSLQPYRLRLCPVSLPGKEKRRAEKLPDDIHELAQSIAASVLAHIHKPYVMLGLCYGASLAYLTAQLTTAAGRPPVGIIVAGGRAPHTPPPVPVSDMTDDDFISTLHRLGFISDIVLNNRELLDLYLPMLKSDFIMDEKFILPYPKCKFLFPISVCYGEKDAITPEHDILEWSIYTSNLFMAQKFKEDQLFFAKEYDRFIEYIVEKSLSLVENPNFIE